MLNFQLPKERKLILDDLQIFRNRIIITLENAFKKSRLVFYSLMLCTCSLNQNLFFFFRCAKLIPEILRSKQIPKTLIDNKSGEEFIFYKLHDPSTL